MIQGVYGTQMRYM